MKRVDIKALPGREGRGLKALLSFFYIEVRFGVLTVKQSSCQWVKPLNLSKRTFYVN
jgi:hypothetical protein